MLFLSGQISEKQNTCDYFKDSTQNLVHFKIATYYKRFVTGFSYGGRVDIVDNDYTGYTLDIKLKYDKTKLWRKMIDILKSHKFGSMHTEYNIMGMRNIKYD